MWKGVGQRVFPMIGFFQFRGEHLFLGLPRIVSRGIPLPLDKVLELAPFSKELMSHDNLHFELLFSVNHFGWWAVIIGAMFFCFVIGGEKGGMEDVMDGPGWGQLELISDS
jgi:hypothetical protein